MEQKWTIMVYMAGDNNLAEEMIGALQQVRDTGVDYKITWAVLFDSGGPLQTLTLPDRAPQNHDSSMTHSVKGPHAAPYTAVKTARLPFRDADFKQIIVRRHKNDSHDKPAAPGKHPANGKQGAIEKRKVIKLRQTPGILRAFIRDTIIKHQADHYMLVLSGHGSGAVGDFLSGNRRRSNLTIQDIDSLLEAVDRDFDKKPYKNDRGNFTGKIDILGLDSCLMSMTEVAYEVKKHVRYLVGAQGFEPNTGWPYAKIIDLLKNFARMSSSAPKNVDTLFAPANVAGHIVQTYVDYYSDYTIADISTDQSALNVTRIGRLKRALNDLALVLQTEIQHDIVRDAIVLAHWESQGYKNEQYVDLWDFCGRLSLQCDRISPSPKRIKDACERVQEVIAGKNGTAGIVLHSCYTGAAFQHSHGISLFFPWANMTDAAGTSDLSVYKHLAFARETKWDEFLKTYLARTQRQVRDGNREVPPDTQGLENSRLNRRPDLVVLPKPGKFDSAVDSKFDSAVDSKFDSAVDSKFDSAVDSKFDSAVDSKFDSAVDSKFLQALQGTKIACMKNPPVRWKPCYDD